jgi:hypothetical protein
MNTSVGLGKPIYIDKSSCMVHEYVAPGDRGNGSRHGLRGLLEWCPAADWTQVFDGKLPWDPEPAVAP